MDRLRTGRVGRINDKLEHERLRLRRVQLDFDNGALGQTKLVEGDIPEGWQGVDIGPKTTELFSNEVAAARTILWNGPVGVFELKPFQGGTRAVMDAVVAATEAGATTIIGGGDTATAAKDFGTEDKVTHVSTGGGASLELLEGKELPGVAALSDR